MRLRRKTFLILLMTAALVIRLGTVIALRDLHMGPTGSSSADDVQFNNLSLNLAQGKGYINERGHPTSFRAPGFPMVLAPIYFLTGPYYPLVYVTLCLLGALGCLLTYFLARELLPEFEARIAAILASLYLPHIYLATVLLSENLFVPCLALGIWLFIRYLRTRSLLTLLLGGLTLGWAVLTRPFAILLLPILLSVLVASQLRARQWRFVPALALVVSFLTVLLPWAARNYRVHGHPVLIATNGGATFYGGNNDRVIREPRYFGYWLSTRELPHRDLIDATPDEFSHDQMEWRLGLQWLKDHPYSIPLLLVYKFVRLWWLPEFDLDNRLYRLVLRVLGYIPFFLLFVLAASRCLRNPHYWTAPWLAVHGSMVATFITALVFWGSTRFRDANMPLLMTYAAVGFGVISRPERLRRVAGRGDQLSGMRTMRQKPNVERARKGLAQG